MSIFDGGRALLDEAFDFASTKIDYSRNGQLLVSGVQAKPAKTVFDSEAMYVSSNLRFSQLDFIIRLKDLPQGTDWEPEQGDLLIDEDGNKFEVVAPQGEPVWRFHEPGTIRIHCWRKK